MYRRIPLSMLSEGFVLASPVHDDDLRLLLGPGIPIGKELMTGLYKRGIRDVVVAEKDWRRLTAFSAQGKARKALPRHTPIQSTFHTDSSQDLDREIANSDPQDIEPSENPFSQQVKRHGAVSYDRTCMDAMVDHHQKSVDQVDALLTQLSSGKSVAADAVHKVTHDALMRATEDLDLFVCMGINPGETNDISAHSTNTATLAVALGATLGQDVQSLTDLGTGCLVHNAGMLQLDEKYYQSREFLNESDFVEIAKHPVIATDMLYKNMGRVPLGVRMIVYQMHERCDGSGYPRGRAAEAIHPLARIASVADAYVALVSKRPHRPAMLPYFAMAKMLEDVKEGLFDPAVVRALLHTVSLFPIGSFVELSDGRIAKTIRANGPAYDKPIVEAWTRSALNDPGDVIDLSEREDIKVVKALTSMR